MSKVRRLRLIVIFLLVSSTLGTLWNLVPVFAQPVIAMFPGHAPPGFGRACLPVGSSCVPFSSSQAVVQVSGSGFAGGSPRTCSLFAYGAGILFDNNPNRTACHISSTGVVTGNFSISSNAAQGQYTINVTDLTQPAGSAQRSAVNNPLYPFVVDPRPDLVLSVASGSAGTTVTITSGSNKFAGGLSSLPVTTTSTYTTTPFVWATETSTTTYTTTTTGLVTNPDQGACNISSLPISIISSQSCFIDSGGSLYSTQFIVKQGAALGGYQINVTGSHGDFGLEGFVVSSFRFGLNPNEGQPGQTVVVTGGGASAVGSGTSCTVTSDNPNLITAPSASVVDSVGDVAGSFIVGSNAAGKAGGGANNVTLTCGTSNTAYQGFTVIPKITLNPTAGAGNQTVSVNGVGYRSDVTGCELGSPTDHAFETLASCTVTGTGMISGVFTVNSARPNGVYNITASGYVGGSNVTTAFALYQKIASPTISVSPNATSPGYGTLDGTPITISGGGFPTGTSRTCTLSSSSSSAFFASSPGIACTISGAGTVSASFAVATTASPGNYTITVTDTASQPFPPTYPYSSTTFRVNGLVNVTLVPSTGPAGTPVFIYTGKYHTLSVPPGTTGVPYAYPLFQPTFDAGTCTITSTPSNIISSPVCFIASNGSLIGPTQFTATSAGFTGYTITVTSAHGDFGVVIFTLTTTTTLTINPVSGSPPLGSLAGTSVSIVGSGYSTSDTSCTVTSSPNNSTKPSVISALSCSVSGGNLLAAFTVAAGATNGTYQLNVQGTPAFDTKSVTFFVFPRIAVSPVTGVNGTLVTVSGAGFTGTINTIPCYSFSSTPLPATSFPLISTSDPNTVCNKNSDGTVYATFRVGGTKGTAQGAYTVLVDGTGTTRASPSDNASAVFAVGARLLTITPSVGIAGTVVSVTGTGFYPNDTTCFVSAFPHLSTYLIYQTPTCSITNGVVAASFNVTLGAAVGPYNIWVNATGTPPAPLTTLDKGVGVFTVGLTTIVTSTSTSFTASSTSSQSTTTVTTTTATSSYTTTTTMQTTQASTSTYSTLTTTSILGQTTTTLIQSTGATSVGTTSTVTTVTTTTVLSTVGGPVIEINGQLSLDVFGLLASLIVLGLVLSRRLLD